MPSSSNQSDLGTAPSSTRSDQTTGVQGEPVLDEGKHTSIAGNAWLDKFRMEGGAHVERHIIFVCNSTTGHAGKSIAFCETEADARILAARVNSHDELVETLRRTQELIDVSGQPLHSDCKEAAALIRAVLSKALGTEER